MILENFVVNVNKAYANIVGKKNMNVNFNEINPPQTIFRWSMNPVLTLGGCGGCINQIPAPIFLIDGPSHSFHPF